MTERALRRAADLAKRAAEAVAKADKAGDAGGDLLVSSSTPPSPPPSQLQLDELAKAHGAKRNVTNGVATRNYAARQAVLPQVHEDRSTEFDFSITFLVPRGLEGEEFMDIVLAVFPEAHIDAASSCSTATVPYGGDKTAMVALHRLGPVEALEHVRRSSASSAISYKKKLCGEATEDDSGWPRIGLPEAADESAALVYVVHAFRSAEDAEQQLGPICSVEASYRVAARKHQPRRIGNLDTATRISRSAACRDRGWT
jgi:hypothetical protein